MNQDFSELIEYLDKKFVNLDQQLADLKENKSDKSDVNNLDKKFVNLDQQLADLKENIADLKQNKSDKSDVNNLMNAIDAYAKKADTFFEEMVALSHKTNRHEKWLHQIADKLGLKLEY